MSSNTLIDAMNASFDAIRDGQRPIDIAFLFRVLGDSGLLGDFQSVEGFSRAIDAYEYQEGGRNQSVHVLPGPAKQGRLSLQWGLMDRSALYDWGRAVEVGASFRQDLTIMQLTRRGMPLRVYTVTGAWPVEWRGAPLDASQSQVPIEELKLAYDDIQMTVLPDAL